MKNLIGMTEFVLEQLNEENSRTKPMRDVFKCLENYAKFLKQPLELWMFVACDEDSNVLENPTYNSNHSDDCYCDKCERETKRCAELQNEYQQAKSRCFFEDFELENHFVTHKSHASFFYPISCLHERTIEDLVKYNLELTATAQKTIEL